MTFGTQTDWLLHWRMKLQELAQLRQKALRMVGLRMAMSDGTGVRGVRNGAYSLGDLSLGMMALGANMSEQDREKIEELKQWVLPMSRAEADGIRAMKRKLEG